MYLASAMCTLKSKGVVHRDLKPQNLLLHHSGTTTPSPSQIKIKIGKFARPSLWGLLQQGLRGTIFAGYVVLAHTQHTLPLKVNSWSILWPIL